MRGHDKQASPAQGIAVVWRALAVFIVSGVMVAASPYSADAPVAEAAQRGDVEAVRSLLRDGADPNAAQPDGMTALHWAAARDQVEVAQVLLYAGATSRATTRLGGYTPLHIASRSGHTAVAKTLLDSGADPNAWTTTGATPLHLAADADAAGVIEALIAAGADVDAADAFAQRTPLMFGAVRGANGAVSALLAGGADVSLTTRVKDYEEIDRLNREEQQARQRVREAAMEPQEPEEDEAPEEEEPEEEEPEEQAEEEREPEPEPEHPVKRLSSAQQIGKQGGFTALHYAAREGHLETARQLTQAGADVDQPTGGDQSTAMLVAVINGNYDLARMLLEAGADPNIVSDDGVGPLFATLNIEWSLRTWYPQPSAFRQQETSYLDLMRLLLEAGAAPNERTTTHVWYAAYNAGRMGVDFTGATPFWRAAYARDVEAMKLLVEYGADPNLWTLKLPVRRRFGNFVLPRPDEEEEDPSGLEPVPVGGPAVHPLHAAAGVGFGTSRVAQQHRSVPGGALPSLKYMIEELGIEPNLRDADGFNAIHHSAARGDNETILYLVSQGVDVTAISRQGHTTADMANSPEQRQQPIPETVALLEKLGSANNHNCRACGGS